MISGMKAFSNFVNGARVEAEGGQTTDVVDPATATVYATAPRSTSADVDAAMRAAAAASAGVVSRQPSRPAARS